MRSKTYIAVGLLVLALVFAGVAVFVGFTSETSGFTSEGGPGRANSSDSGRRIRLPYVSECPDSGCGLNTHHGNFWPWAGLSLVFGAGGVLILQRGRHRRLGKLADGQHHRGSVGTFPE